MNGAVSVSVVVAMQPNIQQQFNVNEMSFRLAILSLSTNENQYEKLLNEHRTTSSFLSSIITLIGWRYDKNTDEHSIVIEHITKRSSTIGL